MKSFFNIEEEKSNEIFLSQKHTSTTTPVDDNKDFVGEYDDRRSFISVPVLRS